MAIGGTKDSFLRSNTIRVNKNANQLEAQVQRWLRGFTEREAKRLKRETMSGDVRLVKGTAANTTLAEGWNPDGGPLYSRLLRLVYSAVSEVRPLGRPMQIAGFFWMQVTRFAPEVRWPTGRSYASGRDSTTR